MTQHIQHIKSFLCIAGVLVVAANPALAELRTMSDTDLAAVGARDGISLRMDLRVNADASGNPLASVPVNERRLALQFNNHNGEWLILRNFYGRLLIPRLNLDAGYSSGSRDAATGNPSTSNVPALLVSMPEAMRFYNITIGGMSVEYDRGTTDAGMTANVSPSFVGLKLHDSQQAYGTLTVTGSATIYGY